MHVNLCCDKQRNGQKCFCLCTQDSLADSLNDTFLNFLDGLIIRPTGVRKRSRAKTDGSFVYNAGSVDTQQWALYGLLEYKLDATSGVDSGFQGAVYYGMWWEHRKTSPFFLSTCCPALLIEVVGPMIRASALTFMGKVRRYARARTPCPCVSC